MIKEIPGSFHELVRDNTNQLTPAGLYNRQSQRWAQLHDSLFKGWVMRLRTKSVLYAVKTKQRLVTYNFKKNFRPINEANRRAFKKLFFPDFVPSKLTRFFIKTKAAPKKELCVWLIQSEYESQPQLHWVMANHTLRYFKDLWVWSTSKTALSSWAPTARTQVPFTTTVLRFILHINKSNLRELENPTKALSRWSHDDKLLDTDTFGADKITGAFGKVAIDEGEWSEDIYYTDGDGEPEVVADNFGTRFWNQHIRTGNMLFKPSENTPQIKPIQTLARDSVYDYRSLHTLTYRPAGMVKYSHTGLTDLNLLNFRVFNWGIIV